MSFNRLKALFAIAQLSPYTFALHALLEIEGVQAASPTFIPNTAALAKRRIAGKRGVVKRISRLPDSEYIKPDIGIIDVSLHCNRVVRYVRAGGEVAVMQYRHSAAPRRAVKPMRPYFQLVVAQMRRAGIFYRQPGWAVG